MKKIFSVVAVASVAIMFASCSKSYTCTCKIIGPGVKDSTLTIIYKGVSQSSANESCKNTEAAGNTSGLTFSCVL